MSDLEVAGGMLGTSHIDAMMAQNSRTPGPSHGNHREKVPAFELEADYDYGGTATLLQVYPSSPAVRKVRLWYVMGFIPSGASGLLTLGPSVQIPVGSGTFHFSLHMLLQQQDVRILQSSAPGVMSLVLMGDQLSDDMLVKDDD